MAIGLIQDKTIIGKEVYPKGSSVNVRSGFSTATAIIMTVKSGEVIGKATGYCSDQKDGRWYQVRLTGDKFGYVRSDVVTLTAPKQVTKTDALGIIQKLVESDKKVYETLLLVAPLITSLKSKGQNMAAHEAKHKSLFSRLNARQDAIKKSNVVKWQTGIKKSYEKFVSTMPDPDGLMMAMHGLGAIQAGVIVGVVAGAALTAAAYFIFKPKYDESTTDLKISSDLETLLAKADPATAQKIKNDLETQIDDAYNQGKTDGTFGGMGKILIPIALLFGGYFLFSSFIRKESKK